MRIQKYISQCGFCSRREAERRIENAEVYVNGQLAQIGQIIDEKKDKVEISGKILQGIVAEKVVLAMNKPKGYLCSNDDPFEAQTVFDLLPAPYDKMKMFCCGRLDKGTKGLLIITNDGELSNRIIHPSSGIIKRYMVTLNRDLDEKVINILLRGVISEGEKLKATKIIQDTSLPNGKKKLEVWLNQGRKREIRRMFEVMGYFVKDLKRTQVGAFVLKRIAEGKVKKLNKKDIQMLLRNE